jgi:CHAT domain-containing protein
MARIARLRSIAQTGLVLFSSLLVSSAPVAVALAGFNPQSKPQVEMRAVEPGKAIEQELAGGQTHSYQISLAASQYLRLIVEQKGIDVVVALFGPDDNKLTEVDSPNGTQGPERVSVVTEAAGTYRLEVRSLEPNAPAGRYEVKIQELRQALPQDISRIAAQKMSAEAAKLRAQATPDALEKAIEKFEQTLTLWREAGDRSSEAATLFNIAAIYHHADRFQKALDYYNSALGIYKAISDKNWEGSTLSDIANVYHLMHENQRALGYLEQALALYRTSGDRKAEAGILNNIASVYSVIGEHQKSIDPYTHALALYRTLADRLSEGQVLSNLAGVYDETGQRQKALELYDQALALRRALKDRAGESITLSNMAWVYRRSSEYRNAIEYFNQALAIDQATNNRRREAFTLGNIASAYDLMGEKPTALDYYNRALQTYRSIKNQPSEVDMLRFMARTEREMGNLDQARAHIESALGIIESLRAELTSQQLRASYLARIASAYEFYIDLLMQLHERQPSAGHEAAALETSERARARSLLETLVEARANIRQGVDAQTVESLRNLRQQLSVKAELQTRILAGKHTDEQAQALNKEIEALTTRYQDEEAQIRLKSPAYAALTQPRPLSLLEIQKQVLDPDTLLLEYWLGKDRSYLWAVSQSSITAYQLPKRADIETSARRVYELITERSRRVLNETSEQEGARLAQAMTQYQEAAAGLSQIVLGPVAPQLGNKRLLVVADGALQYVPFATVPVPAAQNSAEAVPMIAEHEIINLPSASVLGVLRRETANRKPAPRAVAVLADPVFEAGDARIASSKSKVEDPKANTLTAARETEQLERSLRESGLTEAGVRIPRLINTRREAAAVVALATEQDRKQSLDFEASRATATSAELGQYRFVHFATHGLLNSQHPELSGVVLSLVDKQGKPQDGFLRLIDIYNLRLPVELVVLSACQTGLGKEIRGEGLVSLTRGFMYAGAPRVVASLWKVDDKATAELMKRFYQGMLGDQKLRPAAALRAAQVVMWKQKQWREPYYWAAFVLHGEWR